MSVSKQDNNLFGPCKISIEAQLQEQVDLEFTTNGFQGGNRTHGGRAKLTISTKCGDATARIHPNGKYPEISFTTGGDMEIEGFILGLIRLGRSLEQHYRASLSYKV